MKTLIYCIAVALLSQQTYAQCNVKSTVDEKSKYVYADGEALFKNQDTENGARAVYAALSDFQSKGSDFNRQFIEIMSAASGEQTFVFPRQLTITFSDNTSITLQANSSDSGYKGIGQAVKCYFTLSKEDWDKLTKLSVVSISIYDNRTGASLQMHPYGDLLKEQATCLVNEMGDYK